MSDIYYAPPTVAPLLKRTTPRLTRLVLNTRGIACFHIGKKPDEEQKEEAKKKK